MIGAFVASGHAPGESTDIVSNLPYIRDMKVFLTPYGIVSFAFPEFHQRDFLFYLKQRLHPIMSRRESDAIRFRPA